MKSGLTWLFAAVALLVVNVRAAEPATQPAAPPAVGDIAKDFTLNDLNAKPVQLSALTSQGPVVVIMLRGWNGYQCPICAKQVGQFRAAAKDFDAAGAKIVLIYPGTAEGLEAHAAEFIQGKGLPENFHFVLDPDLKFTNAYNLRWDAPKETAYPSTFLIDRTNVIRFAKISHSHDDRASASSVLKALGDLK